MQQPSSEYAAFLPDDLRSFAVESAEEEWWPWRQHRVHLARRRRPDSEVRLWVLHGAGGWSGALWPIASVAAVQETDLTAIDLPLYGRTVTADPRSVRYREWVDLLDDLAEAEDDGRPLVVLGASMGGMLGYEVAARTRAVAHVVATCLLDLEDPAARRAAARTPWLGSVAPFLLKVGNRVAPRARIPISWVADMSAMSLNPSLSRLCATDPRGGGSRVPIGWLADYFGYRHQRPEAFDACPVTLAHPALDEWTPPELSIAFARRIAAPTEIELLAGCGHFPIEQPGLSQLQGLMRRVIGSVTAG